MARTAYWAHSGEAPDKSDWQPLAEHLQNVADLAAEHAAKFGAAEWGRMAGLLHDAGKFSEAFQDYIEGKPARVDHATFGAVIAAETWKKIGRLLAYVIAGHHAGLANGDEADTGDRTCLMGRLRMRPGIDVPDASPFHSSFPTPVKIPPPPLSAAAGRGGTCTSFFARMLFSCLVDADRLDTERWDLARRGEIPLRAAWPLLSELRSELNAYLTKLGNTAAQTDVNLARAEILSHVRSRASSSPGHFSLTVPTGGGKTLASLAFALDHAVRHDMDRVIVVIPYTSIIEQTAEVYRRALGVHAECVLEHHSAFDDEKPTVRDPEGIEKLRFAAENWDAPIIVTTAVQFFESLFSASPTKCRKLHNIARSVVVLDEAQTLPLPLLRPSVAALDQLARNYGVSIVLSTATQPALAETDDPSSSFRGGLPNVRELAPEPPRLFERLRRVRVENLGTLEESELAALLARHEQGLCIVHTRAQARRLFQALQSQPGTMHLSALMCAEHRSQQLAEIRRRLIAGEPCRLVATSLIEAGVDVDFPVVYRAAAGIDSLAQAAGRCNREGKRDPAASVVHVFELAGAEPPPSQRVTADAGREILRRYADDPFSLDAVHAYFRRVYWALEAGTERLLDERGILAALEERATDFLFPFETVGKAFRVIEETMRPVLIPYSGSGGRGTELLDELARADQVRGIARKLQRYVVQVPKPAFAGLVASGAIQAIRPERFDNQFWQLANLDLYRDDMGLDFSDPTFRRVEALVL
jgi:CRISPR-associated endonuclease/helicase Cas3